MAWRLAKSLETLRAQVNAKWPTRRRDSDGSIGDEAHATRNSDHNPWVTDGAMGIVTAIDITHDPASGCDSYMLAEVLRGARDPRVKYVISNRKICNSAAQGSTPPWGWRPYTGTNPHNHHVHISVLPDKALYDSTTLWNLDAAPAEPPAPSTDYMAPPPTLRLDSSGGDVKRLQELLNQKGATLKVDASFGPKTKDAVIAFQQSNNLVPDGIVGPATWRALGRS
jgi:hypothetical protein